ncbi:MAG: hypothetical protein NTX25_20135 [Proteobacteria bacterium]|nr:hypothetical protein [Pseudomonadota bacterium]
MVGSVLFVDCSGYKSLPSIEALRIISAGQKIESVTSIQAALQIMQNKSHIDILVCNSADIQLLSRFRLTHPKGQVILVTELPMKDYSSLLENKEETFLDHVIANKGREGWTIHQLRVTLNKILSQDLFGIEKYLAPFTLVKREQVSGSAQREELNTKVMRFVEACHLGQHAARMAFGITEELLMNTVYDAPAAAGIARFKSVDQTLAIVLQPEEYGELSYGCDGQVLAISTSDPFGALRKETLLSYLKKVLKREETVGLIDEKRGGAGLGLFKILYSSHGIVCNVKPGVRTEIMALIDVNEQLRDFASMARSIHYFSA